VYWPEPLVVPLPASFWLRSCTSTQTLETALPPAVTVPLMLPPAASWPLIPLTVAPALTLTGLDDPWLPWPLYHWGRWLPPEQSMNSIV